MKTYLKFLLPASLILLLNVSNANAQATPLNVHQKTYSKLSPEEQKSYIEDFSKNLSVDEDYYNMKVSIEQMKNYILQMKKIPGDSVKKKRGSADEISYYRERGMTNPEDYIKIRASVPKYIFNVRSKFPAYGNLDRQIMRQITQKADSLLNIK
ncbi:hypothetical protein [Pedobacter sp. N23S346]|uniref:hypothetical protein n=1 Tax=Pedobacter sp. N23S346 TaxID=3402750 RepID=UPI003ACEACC1